MNITTEIQPTLTQISIYPIKSLDGKIVDRAKILTGGALEYDRRWAIIDDCGKVVNAKRTAKIHQLRAQFDFSNIDLAQQLVINIQTADDANNYQFCLTTEVTELARWLSAFFGFPVSLIENATTGFPDDLNAYGPTIVSTTTLETICGWFPNLDLAEARRRFRTNLEIGGVPAFWEDRLFGAPGTVIDFQLGDVRFHGVNPCQRCIVPTRNSISGDLTPKFQQIFTQQRDRTLPPEVNKSRFNHFYRLAVNTQIPPVEAGKFLKTGDFLGFRS
ncbi:MOSC N-terminal beta barrel domain-containing protein [Chamaesiphon sp. VAR_48_metabat_403]|uniref:MOSC domain-containing protein n=1 Tax=Chamaesiphon sp. VAR_48_metabat_403 TaxID=2964700 RepID=UPI00286DC8A4|nr:MOSC N-terminal beta barrel domain-containing protein [Chamaesiphon sp. VAR_48_metabat_403]